MNGYFVRMVGTISQLGLLSEYASEIFSDIVSSTDQINDRILNISKRSNIITSRLSEIEQLMRSDNFRMATGATGSRTSEQNPHSHFLTKATMPAHLAALYNHESVAIVSPVHEIDRLLTDEELAKFGPCAKKYSYPDYFLEEWLQVQRCSSV